MPQGNGPSETKADPVLDIARQYWGFDKLRPLQEAAIHAGLERRDSLVVMPTGGGKSLCYQVPPVLDERMDIVVSPLISLMKDQVDGLRACGYPAAAIHSNLSSVERRETWHRMMAREYRLVFVAPERLFHEPFLDRVLDLGVRTFAIDEAHCISHWGHDFRPEYRRLAELKTRFPDISVHAFTATATPRVRDDIIEQLSLKDPTVLVGTFDRTNLTYRVVPRVDVKTQVCDAVKRHEGEAAIIYCISRKDTESMASSLKSSGVNAEAYHAGLPGDHRQRIQEAFATERTNVVCATVAFGMGIDRSDVRLVAHAAMPKSVEHYQQETGRAGRDGLPSECVLFYSPADVMKWETIIANPRDHEPPTSELLDAHLALLNHMRRYASSSHCRHKFLSEYFGQSYEADRCDACDACLNEIEGMEDATELAQKIISCVYRVGERFGISYVVDVLSGSNKEQVVSRGHDRLSTHGLLREMDRRNIQDAAYQLIDQGLLERTEGEYPIVQLNRASWEVLNDERGVQLRKPPQRANRRTRQDAASWEGVDRDLFESLRTLRRRWADERAVPPYLVFSDATLRDLARIRPASESTLRLAHGIGNKKLEDYGTHLIEHIKSHCQANALQLDQALEHRKLRSQPKARAKEVAGQLFTEGASIEVVMAQLNRARRTVIDFLVDHVAGTQTDSIDAWVSPEIQQRVIDAASVTGTERLKPIHEHLNGEVPYDDIKIVVELIKTRES